jgi:diguanylate cyclase (GGDEF)-like protein
LDTDVKTRITALSSVAVSPNQGDCLVIIYSKDLNLGKRYLLEAAQLQIGRGMENQIVLESDAVSRRHATVEARNGRWWVRDLGSTNGTYVNHAQVTEHPLAKGDLIKIGDTIFKYLTGSDVEAAYHEEIYRMTIMDGLTQVYNKRYLLEAIEREIARARRYDRPLSVLMFDIDHFKKVNDSFGHLAGDQVLKDLAALVSSRVRREEVLGRYGGEEFLIVLPETDEKGATELADQIRRRVEAHPFQFDDERILVTISVGVATLGQQNLDVNTLLRLADENLYKAKRQGRNCVVS